MHTECQIWTTSVLIGIKLMPAQLDGSRTRGTVLVERGLGLRHEEPAAIPVSAELGKGIGKRGEHGGVVRRWEDDDRQV